MVDLHEQAIFLINAIRSWMPLDKTDQGNIWIIKGDLCYETPGVSADGGVA